MNIKKLMLVAMLAVTASVSVAQETVDQETAPIPLTLTRTGPNLFGTTFERSVTGLFVDVFSFTPASLSGTVSVSLRPLDGSVSFFAALLNNEGFSFLPESSNSSTFSFQTVVDATRPLSLTVFGYGGDPLTFAATAGRYAGTIQVATITAAVPEPETYALFLVGLGVLGAVRRRSARRGPVA